VQHSALIRRYEWNVMPFGLKSAPSEFQNIMNDIFNPFSRFTIVYIDDVLIFSKRIEEHWKHLNAFLETIKHNGLVVSASKIKLLQTKIRFLGFDIFEGKIRPIDRAIQFADKFPDVITEKTHVCQHNVCFHIPSVLVKGMSEQVILGIPFIAMIFPFTADFDGISTIKMGIPIVFHLLLGLKLMFVIVP
jgi:hypothetical protein